MTPEAPSATKRQQKQAHKRMNRMKRKMPTNSRYKMLLQKSPLRKQLLWLQKKVTKETKVFVNTLDDAALDISLAEEWKFEQSSPKKKVQKQNALAAQDEASIIPIENVDDDYISEASGASTCKK